MFPLQAYAFQASPWDEAASLAGEGGYLAVSKGAGEPVATLTVSGLSGLVYGVLDPIDVITRGLGHVGREALVPLRELFPATCPSLRRVLASGDPAAVSGNGVVRCHRAS